MPGREPANGLGGVTNGLGNTTQGVTDGLGETVGGVNPELGQTVTDTGKALSDIVKGSAEPTAFPRSRVRGRASRGVAVLARLLPANAFSMKRAATF